MTNFLKAALLSTAAIASTVAVATPAAAQNRNAAAQAPRVGVFNAEQAVQQSAAFTTAVQQIQVTYAPQIQARNARATALNAELQPLLAAAQAQANATPRNEQAFNTAVQAYQTRAQAAERELQQLAAPYELAVQYAREQVALRLQEALGAAATARGLDIVLVDEAVAYRAETASVTPAVVEQLNRLVPNVQIVPPAGYQPGALVRAAQEQARAAAQAAQPGAPATPTPPPAQPQTR